MPFATTEVQEQLDSALTAIKTLDAENDEIIKSIKTLDSGALELDNERVEKYQANVKAMDEQQGIVKLLRATIEGKEFLDAPARGPLGPMVDAAELVKQLAGGAGGLAKDVGSLFTESEQFAEIKQGQRGIETEPFLLKVHDLGGLYLPRYTQQKDVYTALPGTNPYGGFGTVQREPMVLLPMRPGRVRDLFPVNRTTARVIEFFRETAFNNNASVVAERVGSAFGMKPQSTFTFDYQSVTTQTIAHWEAAHRNVLADEPQLQDLINSRLLYGLTLHEDYQILYGTGTGQDLHGILLDPAIQTHLWSAGANATANVVADNMADALRRALTKTTLALFPATGIVVHPSDWEKIELIKNTQGNYLLATSIAQGGQMRVWQTPVVTSFAIDPGTALVGAFGLGAQLYDREEATIRTTDSHADWFPRNAVMILAEERLALTMQRPKAFVKVTFDHAPT